MKRRRKNYGFSLIEMMVALLAGVVLALLVGSMIVFSYMAWAHNTDAVKVQDDGSVAMIMIGREIRESGINDILIDGVSFADNPFASGSRLDFSANAVRPASSLITVVGDKLIHRPAEFVLVEDWLNDSTARFNPNGPSVDILLHIRGGNRMNETIIIDTFSPRN